MDHRHLLDRLAALSGCDCLSDLRGPWARRALFRALAQLPADTCPPAQWREAALYLRAPAQAEEDPGQIRQGLLAWSAP